MTSIYLEDACPLGRDAVRAELKKRNIDTRDVFRRSASIPSGRCGKPRSRAARASAPAASIYRAESV